MRVTPPVRSLLGSLLCAAAACATLPRVSVEQGQAYFSAERLSRLRPEERAAWERYLARSAEALRHDQSVLHQEVRDTGHGTWIPAGDGPVFEMTAAMNDAWFAGPEALRLADAVVSYQTPSGGWSKRVDLSKPRSPGQSWAPGEGWHYAGTFDNLATVEHLQFLARVQAKQPKETYATAFTKGIAYVLAAQFPNGCFPQVYPLEGGYHDAVTFNDDALIRVLGLLRSVARGETGQASDALRAAAAAGVERGISCILAAQVRTDDARTVWCAQHDPLTLQPVRARAYEHESLSGRESAAILDFLMTIEPPSAGVVQAVHAAAAWFRTHAIYGHIYQPRGLLVAHEGAGPLWARFYELGSNRPLFSDRDGVRRYDLREISEERRTGYLWYTDEPRTTLRRYEAWLKKHGIGDRGSRIEDRN